MRIWARSLPKPPTSAQIFKIPIKTLCWISLVCEAPVEACWLVALWWGLISITTSHLFFTLCARLSTAQSLQTAPLAPWRARLTPAQHLQQWLPHAHKPVCIQDLKTFRHFKHFLNYVVVSTSLKLGLWYTINEKMYKLSDAVSICSSMWNYTRNRRLLSEKSIFLSFLWLC